MIFFAVWRSRYARTEKDLVEVFGRRSHQESMISPFEEYIVLFTLPKGSCIDDTNTLMKLFPDVRVSITHINMQEPMPFNGSLL